MGRKMTAEEKGFAAEIRDCLDALDDGKPGDRVLATAPKLAKVLDMDVHTLRHICNGLPIYNVGKRTVRYRISDVAMRLCEVRTYQTYGHLQYPRDY